ncbi:MAG: MFS transporter [Candidatus Saganbacteria bacterium]|nr:MFS transporter [Candidatus Saganbacteria bacterium]
MKKYSVAFVTSIAAFIFALDTTMMNVAITNLAQDLHTTIQHIQFAIALYALVIAAFMLLGAKLGKLYGTKRIFLIGAILYGIGTLTAALSLNVSMLTLGWSVIEGVGSAFMMPCAVALIMTAYTGKKRAIAFAIFTCVSIGAVAIGPIVGGAFTTYLSWRWAFGTEFFLVLLILAYSSVLIEQKDPQKARLDLGGALLSVLGFGCVAFGVITSNTYGWWQARNPCIICGVEIAPFGLSIAPLLIFAGAISLILFVLWERRQERKGNEPLMPTSLLKNGSYMAATIVTLIQLLCLAAILFTVPFFMQLILQKNAMQTGLIIMPLTLSMMVTMLLTPRIATKVSVKHITLVGLFICIIGLVLMANSFSVEMSTTALIPGFIIFGIGIGLALAQLQNLALSSVAVAHTDEAAGLFNSLRNLGSSFGTAIVGTLLISFFLSGLVLGINQNMVFPEADKGPLATTVTQTIQQMQRANLEKRVTPLIGNIPNQEVLELKHIIADAIGFSMRICYYTLAAIMFVGFMFSFFLSKQKIVPSIEQSAGVPIAPQSTQTK